MSRDSDLHAQIRLGEQQVDLADALNRLSHDADFKLLTKAILKDEFAKAVGSLYALEIGSPEYQRAVRGMDAVSYLKAYLGRVVEEGNSARVSVHEARRYLGERIED